MEEPGMRNAPAATPVATESAPVSDDDPDAPPAPGAVGGFMRLREERLILLVGFGTGLLIGLFFLTYIVLAIASGGPHLTSG